jgi:hypothetical protein
MEKTHTKMQDKREMQSVMWIQGNQETEKEMILSADKDNFCDNKLRGEDET